LSAKSRTKIIMTAWNPQTRRFEEVFPEDEISASEMTPMFFGSDQQYYTVPGINAGMVYAEWIEQQLG
jgi:peptide subunit release factor RF-3